MMFCLQNLNVFVGIKHNDSILINTIDNNLLRRVIMMRRIIYRVVLSMALALVWLTIGLIIASLVTGLVIVVKVLYLGQAVSPLAALLVVCGYAAFTSAKIWMKQIVDFTCFLDDWAERTPSKSAPSNGIGA